MKEPILRRCWLYNKFDSDTHKGISSYFNIIVFSQSDKTNTPNGLNNVFSKLYRLQGLAGPCSHTSMVVTRFLQSVMVNIFSI